MVVICLLSLCVCLLTMLTKAFTFPNTALRAKGVTKVIRNIFFPGYCYEKLRGRLNDKGKLRLRAAKARGMRLDRELVEYCKRKDHGNSAYLLPETRLVLKSLQKKGLTIESTQNVVYYEPWRLCTAIDMVLVERKGPGSADSSSVQSEKKILVEVKRGCEYRDSYVPCVRSRFLQPQVQTSPANMHQLQILIGKHLFLHLHPDEIVECWVLYVNEEKVHIVEEKDFTVKWSDVTASALCRTSNVCAGRKRKKIVGYKRKKLHRHLNKSTKKKKIGIK